MEVFFESREILIDSAALYSVDGTNLCGAVDLFVAEVCVVSWRSHSG